MGKATKIVLFNGTPWKWKRNDISHSYQMVQYEKNFPDEVSPGYGTADIYVEFESDITTYRIDTGGEVGYDIQAPGNCWSFQIKVFDKPPRIRFESSGFAVNGSGGGILLFNLQTVELGFNWDRETNFILSGNGTWGGKINVFNCNGVEDHSWMQNSLPYLGQRRLRQICMPGSHDAGMGEITKTDLPQSAIEPITRCQGTTIKRQLELGSRFFDIRPAISGGHFFTGHYDSSTNFGARGQSLSSIIDDVNDFTRKRKELIILSMSTGKETDKSFRQFKAEEWQQLMDMLYSGLDNLFFLPDGQEKKSLLTLTLNDFIGNNKAAVVVVMRDYKDLKERQGKGFFTWEQFKFREKYTDTEDLMKMVNHQIDLMRNHNDEDKANGDESLRILSWTLTPQTIESALLAPFVNVFDPILPNQLKGKLEQHNVRNLAEKANRILMAPHHLFNLVSTNNFPNVLYLDYVDITPVLALAMAINGYTAPTT